MLNLRKSRCTRDYDDPMILYNWLKLFNPLDLQDGLLKSLNCGLAANESDRINYRDETVVGQEIMTGIDVKVVTD